MADFLRRFARPMLRAARSIVSFAFASALACSSLACSGTDGVKIDDPPASPDAGGPLTLTPPAFPAGRLPEPPSTGNVDPTVTDFDTTPILPPGMNPGTGAPPPSSDPIETLREGCVNTINYLRNSIGRAPLRRWDAAEACVDAQGHFDAYSNQPHAAYTHCHEYAQNECPDWPGASPQAALASCLQTQWSEGPSGGHFRNMASSEWSHVACGFYMAPNGRWWLVQNFR